MSCEVYEVWNLSQQRGKLELGLHFESRDRAVNARLLQGFSRWMVEVKATAARLARAMTVLQPIWDSLSRS
jgi:hypothetical protein